MMWSAKANLIFSLVVLLWQRCVNPEIAIAQVGLAVRLSEVTPSFLLPVGEPLHSVPTDRDLVVASSQIRAYGYRERTLERRHRRPLHDS